MYARSIESNEQLSGASETDITLIPVGISNYICYKVLDEITYSVTNFNDRAVEVWEWISNFISHLTVHANKRGPRYPNNNTATISGKHDCHI